ncbi:MAG: DUF1902 domain-containing protein [Burkholderiaceae bacterium]|nr:DUF1902 domain-containing protein [Burkholderiaceae bacterium]
MYPIEYPLWSILARFGRRLIVKIDVQHDEEAGVYIATSQNLNGLICEAATMDELKAETERVMRDLVAFCVRGQHPALPVLEWPK